MGNWAMTTIGMDRPPHFEPILTSFINDLAQLSGPCVLVLEDFQAITAEEINHSLAFLLDHLPDSVHIVLITRSEPALPLARLRARGEMIEISAADLRFSPDEIAAFLRQT